MSRFFLPFMACMCLLKVTILSGEQIEWQSDYESARKEAAKSSKMMLLFFSGGDSCEWSKLLESRIFSSNDFMKNTRNSFVFMKVSSATQNLLMNKFNVRSSPTVLLVDNNEKSIAMTGYFSGKSSQYAEFLLESVEEYRELQSSVSSMAKKSFSAEELEQLYVKARELHITDSIDAILTKGMTVENNTFFLLEKYRSLVESGKIFDKETSALKKKLLSSSDFTVHYRVAVIDFQELSVAHGSKQSIKPLVDYLNNYGGKDSSIDWKVNMTIAQYLYKKNHTEEALKYAESCYKSAPQNMKKDIALAIEGMKSSSSTSSKQ